MEGTECSSVGPPSDGVVGAALWPAAILLARRLREEVGGFPTPLAEAGAGALSGVLCLYLAHLVLPSLRAAVWMATAALLHRFRREERRFARISPTLRPIRGGCSPLRAELRMFRMRHRVFRDARGDEDSPLPSECGVFCCVLRPDGSWLSKPEASAVFFAGAGVRAHAGRAGRKMRAGKDSPPLIDCGVCRPSYALTGERKPPPESSLR